MAIWSTDVTGRELTRFQFDPFEDIVVDSVALEYHQN
jgi:hypothetical protein